jgi:hypothetical protein
MHARTHARTHAQTRTQTRTHTHFYTFLSASCTAASALPPPFPPLRLLLRQAPEAYVQPPAWLGRTHRTRPAVALAADPSDAVAGFLQRVPDTPRLKAVGKCVRAPARTRAHSLTHSLTRTHARMHTRTHTHRQTRRQAHTHTPPPPPPPRCMRSAQGLTAARFVYHSSGEH